MYVFEVDFAVIVDKLSVVPFKGLGAFLLQDDVISRNFVPTRFEYCVCKHDSGSAVVVDANGLRRNCLNLGNVDRTGRVVADGNIFVDEERLAINFAELGRAGIGLGFRGAVGQQVRHVRIVVWSYHRRRHNWSHLGARGQYMGLSKR